MGTSVWVGRLKKTLGHAQKVYEARNKTIPVLAHINVVASSSEEAQELVQFALGKGAWRTIRLNGYFLRLIKFFVHY